MKKNTILPVVAFSLVLPLTACASQLFKKASATVASEQAAPVGHAGKQSAPESDFNLESTLDGEWVIQKVGNTEINRTDDYPYIHFVPSEASFYASNGCNVLNGSFTIEKPNLITFHNVLSTMRYCPDAPFDTKINAAISDGQPRKAVYEVRDGEEYLYLEADGERLMTLHKPSLAFLNGNWKVEEINGKKIDSDEVNIFFDVEERRVHGNTGCNSFNGDIYVDPNNPRKLSLSNMAVTMRLCPNIDLQTKFLVALEQTTGARKEGRNAIELTDADSNTVVLLKRIN